MSIINTMLKDLDKRQQGHKVENLSYAQVQYQVKSASKLPWILLAVVSGVLIMGASYNWRAIMGPSHVSAVPQLQQPTQQPSQPLLVQQTSPPVLASHDSDNVAHLAAAKRANQAEVAQPDLIVTQASSTQQLTLESTQQIEATPEYESIHDAVAAPAAEASLQMAAQLAITAKSTAVENTVAENTSVKNAVVENSPAENTAVKIIATTALADTSAAVNQDQSHRAEVQPSSMAVSEVKLSNKHLAQKQYQFGSKAESIGRLTAAIAYYQQALALDSPLHQARKRVAALYYGQQNLTQASEVLKQGVALYPKELDYAILLARVQQAQGAIDDALATLSLIADNGELASQKWLLQTSLAQQNSDFALAEQSFRNLLRLDATQARWWMGLAYSLDNQQQYGAAKQAYQQALFYKARPRTGLSTQALDYVETRMAQLGDFL